MDDKSMTVENGSIALGHRRRRLVVVVRRRREHRAVVVVPAVAVVRHAFCLYTHVRVLWLPAVHDSGFFFTAVDLDLDLPGY